MPDSRKWLARNRLARAQSGRPIHMAPGFGPAFEAASYRRHTTASRVSREPILALSRAAPVGRPAARSPRVSEPFAGIWLATLVGGPRSARSQQARARRSCTMAASDERPQPPSGLGRATPPAARIISLDRLRAGSLAGPKHRVDSVIDSA